MTIDTRSHASAFSDSIVNLQRAKGMESSEAYIFMSGYLSSYMVGIIDQLPKAKRHAVLADMARTTLVKESQAEVLLEKA
jgi:hypothetical protein